jgi:alkylation response protein AidB-like acyl-CoA dehydrogenase
MTPDDVLAAVRAMAPTVADRAAEAEAARRLPADLLDGLRDAGCFRMSMPESHAVSAPTSWRSRRSSRPSPAPTPPRPGR